MRSGHMVYSKHLFRRYDSSLLTGPRSLLRYYFFFFFFYLYFAVSWVCFLFFFSPSCKSNIGSVLLCLLNLSSPLLWEVFILIQDWVRVKCLIIDGFCGFMAFLQILSVNFNSISQFAIFVFLILKSRNLCTAFFLPCFSVFCFCCYFSFIELRRIKVKGIEPLLFLIAVHSNKQSFFLWNC